MAASDGRKGRPWRRLREQVLREEPLCRWCGVRASTVVDHLLPLSLYPHLAHDRQNLAGSCRWCNGSKGNRVAPRPRPARSSPLRW
jgi:5-methylcytosine-specific restriction endonuclease McrA